MAIDLKNLTQEQKKAKWLSYIFLSLMVLGSVGLDQVTKVHAESERMVYGDPNNLRNYQGSRYPVWSSAERPPQDSGFYLSLNLNYVRNQGAAWGVFSEVPDKIRVPFFNIVTFVAVLVIFLFMRSTPPGHRLARLALPLILSGAIGNFIDRMRLGYVIDFIDVNWKLFEWRYFFPNFNVADSAISVGVFFLLVDMLFLEGVRKKKLEALEVAKNERVEPENVSIGST